MKISVIICTFDRATLLEQTLQSLAELQVPDGLQWELIVVDNNSGDDTQCVLRRFADRLPLLVCVEPQPGHSRARNRGIQEASGEYIVWTDDDVMVDRKWLAAYADAFRRHSAANFFGGPVYPWFAKRPPTWLFRGYAVVGWPWALIDLGDEERPFTPIEYAVGANMAYPAVVAKAMPFDPAVGHVGKAMAGGDETDLQNRITRDGGYGVWVPAARVRHYIPAERMTLSYLRRRCFSEGFRSFDCAGIAGQSTIGGVPRWLLRAYADWTLRAVVLRPAKSGRWLKTYAKSSQLRGAIASARSRALGVP